MSRIYGSNPPAFISERGGTDDGMSAPIIERLHRDLEQYLLPKKVETNIAKAASTIEDLLAALRTLLDEAKERGGSLSNGEKMGCAAIAKAVQS
jgi:hypothetical protein